MVEWSGKPAYQQVAERMRERISAGEFSEAGQIPSLSHLQHEYDVSVTVAREAVRQLRSEGLVVSHQGKAAFLTDAAQHLDTGPATSEEDPQQRLELELSEVRAELRELRDRVAVLEGQGGTT